jgi:hypothetical protein
VGRLVAIAGIAEAGAAILASLLLSGVMLFPLHSPVPGKTAPERKSPRGLFSLGLLEIRKSCDYFSQNTPGNGPCLRSVILVFAAQYIGTATHTADCCERLE